MNQSPSCESFMGTFPVSEIKSATNADVVLLGVPFDDLSGIYPEGTQLGPEAIRKSSHYFSGQGLNQQSIHQLNVLDWGNIVAGDYQNVQENLAAKVQQILAKEARAVILGGDHSIALGTARGLAKSAKKHKAVDAIVWIDAHLDVMNEYPQGKKHTRATVLRRILEETSLSVPVYFIGCRGHNLGWEEVEYITERKDQLLPASDFMHPSKISSFLATITSNHKSLYVSLDLDVLDPAFVPGVSVPEPGGLSSRELFHILRTLAPAINCLEVVELNPNLDIQAATARVACKTLFEYFDSL